jgi:hypothetical protein
MWSVCARSLKFGIYTSKGPLTCLAYQKGQPQRPGSCGFEQVDADVYAHQWRVDQVKDDGCGSCPGDDPGTAFTAMRDALNRTGRPVTHPSFVEAASQFGSRDWSLLRYESQPKQLLATAIVTSRQSAQTALTTSRFYVAAVNPISLDDCDENAAKDSDLANVQC